MCIGTSARMGYRSLMRTSCSPCAAWTRTVSARVDWNRTEMVERWQERWAEHVNERLAELDIDARIDHRSLETGIELEPQSRSAPAQRIEGEEFSRRPCGDAPQIARNNGADHIVFIALTRSHINNRPHTPTWRCSRIVTATASTSSMKSWGMHGCPILSNSADDAARIGSPPAT